MKSFIANVRSEKEMLEHGFVLRHDHDSGELMYFLKEYFTTFYHKREFEISFKVDGSNVNFYSWSKRIHEMFYLNKEGVSTLENVEDKTIDEVKKEYLN